MATISHTAAFRAQADFAPEAKIKVGKSVWSEGVAGARLYEQVLSKHPGTVQKVLDLTSELKPPFSVKAVQGHLRWLYTDGQLEVDGTSYVVQTKPKAAKVEAEKTAKVEAPKPAKAEVEKSSKASEEVMSFPPKVQAKFKPARKTKKAA